MLYFYSIASPSDFVLAKLLFNSLLMLVMSLLSIVLFSLFLSNPIQKAGPFIGLVLLGGWSLSLVFTFLAAIAAKGATECSYHGGTWFPADHSAITFANETFQCSIQSCTYHSAKYGSVTGSIGHNDNTYWP